MTRYELEAREPWEGEQTGPEIDYTPEYVVLRDHALAIGRRRGRVTVLLNAVRPLTGFLPARAKARLETTYGIDPVASTTWSVLIEFLVTLAAFALVSIAQMVGAFGYRSGIPTLMILTIGVLAAVDGAVRWGRILAEERPAPGFYEWLLKRPGPVGAGHCLGSNHGDQQDRDEGGLNPHASSHRVPHKCAHCSNDVRACCIMSAYP